MKFKIEMLPPNINAYIGRTNIWQYQQNKKKYHEFVRLSTINIQPKPNYKCCNMVVTYHFKDKRVRDTHNLTKCLLDALVEANIIEDDNYKVLNKYTEIGVYDKGNEYVEISIEEIKENTGETTKND